MSDPWAIIQSMGVKHFDANDEFFKNGNKRCQELLSKFPFISEEDLEDEEEYSIRCYHFGCEEKFKSVSEEANHYKIRHTNVCRTCNASFPSYHLLDCHLLEVHDTLFSLMAGKKPMFQCLLESCKERFQSSNDRKNHCIKQHKFPSDFRFDLNWRKNKVKNSKSKTSKNDEFAMDVCEEVSQSSRGKGGGAKPKVLKKIVFGSGVPKSFDIPRKGKSQKQEKAVSNESSNNKHLETFSFATLDSALPNIV